MDINIDSDPLRTSLYSVHVDSEALSSRDTPCTTESAERATATYRPPPELQVNTAMLLPKNHNFNMLF